MQGKSAENEIRSALELVAAQHTRFDCAVVLRGGGARPDLLAFDGFDLCKTAAALPLPLFTGIGHDVDETVLDLVAHSALKTPTAVADFLLQHNLFFENTIIQLGGTLRDLASRRVHWKTLELANAENALRWSVQARTRLAAQHLQHLSDALPGLSQRSLRRAGALLDQAEALCAALHPDAALRRGFSLTLKDGKVVTRADAVQAGDVLETRLREGVVWSEAT